MGVIWVQVREVGWGGGVGEGSGVFGLGEGSGVFCLGEGSGVFFGLGEGSGVFFGSGERSWLSCLMVV